MAVRWTTLAGGLSPSSRTTRPPSGGGGSGGSGSGDDDDISFAWVEDTPAAGAAGDAASTPQEDEMDVVEVGKGKEVDIGAGAEEVAVADDDEEKRGRKVYKELLQAGGGGKEMYSAKDLDVLALCFAVVKVGGCCCWCCGGFRCFTF